MFLQAVLPRIPEDTPRDIRREEGQPDYRADTAFGDRLQSKHHREQVERAVYETNIAVATAIAAVTTTAPSPYAVGFCATNFCATGSSVSQ